MKCPIFVMRRVIDKQIVDRDGIRLTKVSGLEVELRRGRRPRVTALLTGSLPLIYRFSIWAGRVAHRLAGDQEIRVNWDKVGSVGRDVQLRVKSGESGLALEQWTRNHIVRRIPGSGCHGRCE